MTVSNTEIPYYKLVNGARSSGAHLNHSTQEAEEGGSLDPCVFKANLVYTVSFTVKTIKRNPSQKKINKWGWGDGSVGGY